LQHAAATAVDAAVCRPSGSPVSAADYANHMDMEAAVRKWPLFSMYINYFWNVQDFCITASSSEYGEGCSDAYLQDQRSVLYFVAALTKTST
jgi:hypothetical protein